MAIHRYDDRVSCRERENIMILLHRFHHLSNPRFVGIVLLLYLVFRLPLLLLWPPPMVDEGLFASTAKTLLDTGHLGTTAVKGLESHVYWQPPVYFLALVPVIKMAGYTLTTLRMFSVLISMGVMVLVFILGLKLADAAAAKVAIIVLACDPRFVNTVAFVRMDGLCMLFILVALMLLVRPLFMNRSLNTLVMGVALALAVLTHPLGLIAVTVFTIYILFRSSPGTQEKWREVLLLVSPLAVGAIVWGIYILQDPNSFLVQMKFQFARKDRPTLPVIANVFHHYRLYPLSLAIPCAGLLYVVHRAIRFRGKVVPLAILQTVLTMVVFAKYEIPYHVYIAPLGAISAGMLVVEFWRSSKKVKRYLAAGCLSLILVNTVPVFCSLNYIHHFQIADETNYDKFCELVSRHIPAGASIIGWGTPSVYWGLYTGRPDIEYRDIAIVDSLSGNVLIREAGYVVSTRAFSIDDDEVALQKRREYLSALCVRNGADLKFVAEVGRKVRFAYSAEIYQIVHRPGL